MKWPSRFGVKPSLNDISLLCWLLLATVAAFLFVAHSGPKQIRDADFVQIYSVGQILNNYPANELYNYKLQQKISGEVHPLDEGFYGPSPYPPFVAILFRLFARMPYVQAYLLWMAISAMLYLAALAILVKRFVPAYPSLRPLVFCLALAYFPFLVGTVVNGQLSALGFFALALAIYEDDRGQDLRSGLALSLCAYKPTLLVLILPMLLLTRRFRIVLGFALGAISLIAFATAVEGIQVWSGYFDVLFTLGRLHPLLRLSRYIDIRAFTSLLAAKGYWFSIGMALGCAGAAAFGLVRIWTKSIRAEKNLTTLLWATTLTWTLLLNIYVPVYDSILVVLSCVVSARAMSRFAGRRFWISCVLIFLSAWVAVQIAERTGIQVLTIALAALGALQIAACERETAVAILTGFPRVPSAEPIAKESPGIPIS